MSTDVQEFDIKQVAALRGVTPQAVNLAIKEGKLKANKTSKKWTINLSDLEEYEKNRYSRSFSKLNGHLLFDKEKDLYSATEAAQILGCKRQHVYHALRNKKLAYRKHHHHRWVIHLSDIEEYKQKMRLQRK